MIDRNLEKNNQDNLPDKPEEIIAKVPREAFKAMFYMFTGRPDSSFKSFNRPIIINKDDIIELNNDVQEKLQNHHIDAAITSISFSFKSNKAVDFSSWREFEDTRFTVPDVTETLTIKWDFLIKLPNYLAPQRHTLVVKICSYFTPMQFLEALASRDPSTLDKFELEAVPCFARVDFINHILSEELLQIVENWNKGRKSSKNLTSLVKWLKHKNSIMARIIHYSIPFVGLLLSLSILHRYSHDFGLTTIISVQFIRNIMYWLLLTAVGIISFSLIGRYIANKAYSAIRNTGSYHIFEITNGDKNKTGEFDKVNKGSLASFFVKAGLTLVFNVLMTIIAAIICRCLKI